MSNHVRRSKDSPVRENPSFDERWRGPDCGLITCWEVGRGLRATDPKLAARAEAGQLPVLGWKGGVEKKLMWHWWLVPI